MKTYYKYMWMALFSLFILGACSSGSDELPEPQPKPDPDKTEQESEGTSSGSSIDDMKNKNW
jgi:hypothetical protein